MDGAEGLTLTGQLGEVMKESAEIALSYVRSHAEELGVDPAAFEGRRFHLHVPAGGVPKDGPSAGVTMTTALVSLLTDHPVRPVVGTTGEVTLQGKVLPIGGVRQKVLAAHRAGLTEVVLPQRNGVDLDDVPEHVREQINVSTWPTTSATCSPRPSGRRRMPQWTATTKRSPRPPRLAPRPDRSPGEPTCRAGTERRSSLVLSRSRHTSGPERVGAVTGSSVSVGENAAACRAAAGSWPPRPRATSPRPEPPHRRPVGRGTLRRRSPGTATSSATPRHDHGQQPGHGQQQPDDGAPAVEAEAHEPTARHVATA